MLETTSNLTFMPLLFFLQPLFPKDLHRQPVQAPDHRAEGRARVGGAVHRRLHVQGRDLGAGASAHQSDQGSGESEGARPHLQ